MPRLQFAGVAVTTMALLSFVPLVPQPEAALATVQQPACTIEGTAHSDTLRGTAGDDVICGHEGSDLIRGLAGDDIILGGKGIDTASYSSARHSVYVYLTSRVAYGQGTDGVYVENVVGSLNDDDLRGTNAINSIDGGAGDDVLFGGGGDDFLTGGDGADYCDGGYGKRDTAAACEEQVNVP